MPEYAEIGTVKGASESQEVQTSPLFEAVVEGTTNIVSSAQSETVGGSTDSLPNLDLQEGNEKPTEIPMPDGLSACELLQAMGKKIICLDESPKKPRQEAAQNEFEPKRNPKKGNGRTPGDGSGSEYRTPESWIYIPKVGYPGRSSIAVGNSDHSSKGGKVHRDRK